MNRRFWASWVSGKNHQEQAPRRDYYGLLYCLIPGADYWHVAYRLTATWQNQHVQIFNGCTTEAYVHRGRNELMGKLTEQDEHALEALEFRDCRLRIEIATAWDPEEFGRRDQEGRIGYGWWTLKDGHVVRLYLKSEEVRDIFATMARNYEAHEIVSGNEIAAFSRHLKRRPVGNVPNASEIDDLSQHPATRRIKTLKIAIDQVWFQTPGADPKKLDFSYNVEGIEL